MRAIGARDPKTSGQKQQEWIAEKPAHYQVHAAGTSPTIMDKQIPSPTDMTVSATILKAGFMNKFIDVTLAVDGCRFTGWSTPAIACTLLLCIK